jgi:hypothetical protein
MASGFDFAHGVDYNELFMKRDWRLFLTIGYIKEL